MRIKTSVVELMANQKGKPVNKDVFLFYCYETERTYAHVKNAYSTIQRWPVLKSATSESEEPHKILKSKPLEEWLVDLVGWYAATYPELGHAEKIDYETLSNLSPAFVAMIKDIEDTIVGVTGSPVPKFDWQETHSYWKTVLDLFQKHFALHINFYASYLHWSFGSEVVEKIDLNSCPPVGRFKPKREKLNKGHKRDFKEEIKEPRGEKSTRATKGTRTKLREDNQRLPNEMDEGTKAALEEQALKEVLKGIRKLKECQDLDKVQLPPTNSFYRRIQHEHVLKSGFHSSSAGEGPNRHVVISRVE